jgi:fucose 4-O-acetylase-like acetyltransferase
MTRTTPLGAPPAPAPASGRVALWDNARLLLILLVVFGHLIEGIRSEPGVKPIYDVVYAFHMPGFLLIAGWFARGDALDAKGLTATAKLFATWLLVEAGWALGWRLAGHEAFPDSFLVVPNWTLWFLVTLACMRLALPLLALTRFPLLASIVVALAIGVLPEVGTPFSASRTFALLPIFVLGWRLRSLGVGEAAWFRAPTLAVRGSAAVAALAAVVAVLVLRKWPDFTEQLLFWRRGYAAMEFDTVTGVLLRLTVGVLAVVLVLALLVLVPRRSFPLSSIGASTMTVYLLHAPIIQVLRSTHLDDRIGELPGAIVLMLLIAVVLVLVLASPPVVRILRPITEPTFLLRPIGTARRAS